MTEGISIRGSLNYSIASGVANMAISGVSLLDFMTIHGNMKVTCIG